MSSEKRCIEVFAQVCLEDDERTRRVFRRGDKEQRFAEARTYLEGALSAGATDVEMFDVLGDNTIGYWDHEDNFAYVEMDG